MAIIVTVCLSGWFAPAAWAHGGGESSESLVLVRQAIGFLVNKPGDTMDVEDKMKDAMAAPDKAGVNLALVNSAMKALDAGQMMKVRLLLERSIGARPIMGNEDPVQIGQVPPAVTGEDTGTLVALDPLPGRHGLTGTDWILLTISIVLLAAGAVLSVRMRPHLRRPEGGRP